MYTFKWYMEEIPHIIRFNMWLKFQILCTHRKCGRHSICNLSNICMKFSSKCHMHFIHFGRIWNVAFCPVHCQGVHFLWCNRWKMAVMTPMYAFCWSLVLETFVQERRIVRSVGVWAIISSSNIFHRNVSNVAFDLSLRTDLTLSEQSTATSLLIIRPIPQMIYFLMSSLAKHRLANAL